MTLRKVLDFFRLSAAVLVASGVLCPTVHAQSLVAEGRLPDAPHAFCGSCAAGSFHAADSESRTQVLGHAKPFVIRCGGGIEWR